MKSVVKSPWSEKNPKSLTRYCKRKACFSFMCCLMVQSSFEDAALFSGCNWTAILAPHPHGSLPKALGAGLGGRAAATCFPSSSSVEMLLSVGKVLLAPLGQCFDKMLNVQSHRSIKRFAARLPDLLLLMGREAFFDSDFYGLGTYIPAAGIKQFLSMRCQI